MKIEVKGHSGCNIEIVREGNTFYIEKGTHDPRYVPRLLAQFEKQQRAYAVCSGRTRIPQIYHVTHDNDCAVARMEYVYSQNFIDFFETAGFEEINAFMEHVVEYVESEINASPMQEVSADVVLAKFKDVQLKIGENQMINHDEEIKTLVTEASNCFNSLPAKLFLPMGQCHGDMTFSNILFNKSNLYLIDFLDSFIESPLMDIVKLRQDSAFGWSELMFTGKFDQTRLHIISTRIDTYLHTHFSEYEWYRQYYEAFQLMNFLRILQYAKEDKVIQYLKKVITQLLKGGRNEF